MTQAILLLVIGVAWNFLHCLPIVLGCGVATWIQWWSNRELHIEYGTKAFMIPKSQYDWLCAFAFGVWSSWPIWIFSAIVPISWYHAWIIGTVNYALPIVVCLLEWLAECWQNLDSNIPNAEARDIIEQPTIFILNMCVILANALYAWHRPSIVSTRDIFERNVMGLVWCASIGASAALQYYTNPKSRWVFGFGSDALDTCRKAIKMYNPIVLMAICQVFPFPGWSVLLYLCAAILFVPVLMWWASDGLNRICLEGGLLFAFNGLCCCVLLGVTLDQVFKQGK